MEALRALCQAWLRGDGPMPKRVEWVAGLGLKLAGTAHAAGAVWTQVTSDPVYAALRKAGRRRR
jgi:hypothetical protein